MTCKLQEPTTSNESTSSAEGSPVRTSASQEKELGSPAKGRASGKSTRASSKSSSLDSSSSRTSLDSFGGAWTKLSPDSTNSVTRWRGHASAQVTSEQSTGESVSSSWPTPDAAVSNIGEEPETWLARKEKLKAKGINGNGMGTPLAIAVRLWPTATDAKASGAAGYSTDSGRHSGTTLTDAANGLWATPTARDEKGPTSRNRQGGKAIPNQLGITNRTSLNPEWVECLMGFGPGWTLLAPEAISALGNRRASRRTSKSVAPDSKPSATPSSRKSRKS
jgi:hypothetical protein